MSEQDLVNKMGTLSIQIIRDEKELVQRKKEGTDIANKLQLAADCLELKVKVFEVAEGHLYVPQSELNRRSIEVTTWKTNSGAMFTIPTAEKVAEVVKCISDLEKRIDENKQEKKKLENSL